MIHLNVVRKNCPWPHFAWDAHVEMTSICRDIDFISMEVDRV